MFYESGELEKIKNLDEAEFEELLQFHKDEVPNKQNDDNNENENLDNDELNVLGDAEVS